MRDFQKHLWNLNFVYTCIFHSPIDCSICLILTSSQLLLCWIKLFLAYLATLRVLLRTLNCTCSLKATKANAHLFWQSRLLESTKDDCSECFPNCMQSWKWIPNPAWYTAQTKEPLQQPTECNTSPERVKQAHICSNSHQAQLCIPQPAKQNQTNWWLLKQYGLYYLVLVIKISQGYQELMEVSYYYGTH